MIEPELGAIFKRLASMAEDRYSDYAVGVAVMELMEMAMNAVVERQMAGVQLSAAEKMDREAADMLRGKIARLTGTTEGSGEGSSPFLNANRTVESNYKP